MYFEIAAFLGLISLALFYFAEGNKQNATAGILGAILLVLLGVWMLSDAVAIKTGEFTAIVQNATTDNVTTNTTITENLTYTYTPVTAGFFDFSQLVGIFFILAGLWGAFRYAFNFRNAL